MVMKKLILSFCLMSFAVFSFGQITTPETLTNGTQSVVLSLTNITASPTNGNDDLVIQNAGTNNRTQLFVAPTGTNTAAFFNVANNTDINNAGLGRLGTRGNNIVFGIENRGTPPADRVAKNFIIELDPEQKVTGEAFIVTQNAYNVLATPTILSKVDANGLSTIEAKVQATVAPPDYVFESDYNLRSLEQVESYIKENGHLPEIPSANEFMENGIKLGVMSFDLLKKVEELTLYMIDMKKENEVLRARISTLESIKK